MYRPNRFDLFLAVLLVAVSTSGAGQEHCSRTVKKKAIALVAEKFVQLAMQRRPFPLPESIPLRQIEREAGQRKVATSHRQRLTHCVAARLHSRF